MPDARRNQHRPAPSTATDVQTDPAAGREQMPGKNTEIVVEYCLALFAREMVRILAERGPFSAKTAGDPQVKVIVGVDGHIYLACGLQRRLHSARQFKCWAFGGFCANER